VYLFGLSVTTLAIVKHSEIYYYYYNILYQKSKKQDTIKITTGYPEAVLTTNQTRPPVATK
jgi:hypothetical protein